MTYDEFKDQIVFFNDTTQKWEPPNIQQEILIKEEYDKGKICGECGKENDFSDDCGWFYGYVLETHYVPHCYACWNSKGYRTGER